MQDGPKYRGVPANQDREENIVRIRAVRLIVLAFTLGVPLDAAGAAAPPAPQLYNWTGVYSGLTAGYNWGSTDTTYVAPGFLTGGFFPADQAAISAQGSPNLRPKAFMGGVEFGYNWQLNNVVAGIESDFEYIGLHKAFDGTLVTPTPVNQVTHTDIRTDWLFTLRGRFGWAWDRTLIYATGGLAVADVRFSQTNSFSGIPQPTSDIFNVAETKVGWVIGGGAEQAFGDRWSAKVEYLHVDLGGVDGTSYTTRILLPALPGLISYSHNANVRDDIVRLGLNYKF